MIYKISSDPDRSKCSHSWHTNLLYNLHCPFINSVLPFLSPCCHFSLGDQVCFLGVQLVIRSIYKIFLYWIILNALQHSCTPMKQTWSSKAVTILTNKYMNWEIFVAFFNNCQISRVLFKSSLDLHKGHTWWTLRSKIMMFELVDNLIRFMSSNFCCHILIGSRDNFAKFLSKVEYCTFSPTLQIIRRFCFYFLDRNDLLNTKLWSTVNCDP